MRKYIIIVLLLIVSAVTTLAYAQQNPENQRVEDTTGIVLKVEEQERVIYLQTLTRQMVLSVPKDVIITKETRQVMLTNIKEGDSVFVKYYRSSDAVTVVLSITATEPIVAQ